MNGVAKYTAEKHGVRWFIDDEMTPIKGIPCFWAFSRSPDAPKGSGKKVLSLLCRLLEMKRQPICLQAANTKLFKYYKQFGFVVIEENTMLRLPETCYNRYRRNKR
jgi:hypothetical protein